VLPDGRVVPRVSKYKHLGTVTGSSGGPEVQRERILQKLRGVLSVVCSLEVSLDQMIEMTDCVIEGVVGFYGRSTPLSREFCEKVEKCRRAQFVRVGKRRRGEGNCEVYAEHRAGGLGAVHTYQVARAAMISEVYKGLNTPVRSPVRYAVRSALAVTAWRLGCRVPVWEWEWGHAVGSLSEDWVMEYVLKGVWELGWEWGWVGEGEGVVEADPLRASRWSGVEGTELWGEGSRVECGKGLAALGVESVECLRSAEGGWMEWREFQRWWEAGEDVRAEWGEARRQAEGVAEWQSLGGVGGGEGEEGEAEEEREVARVGKARKGLRGVEYRVEWKGWEGWDTWEPEQHLRRGMGGELSRARELGWEHTSWREWLQGRYSKMEVERRVLWKGSRTSGQ